MVNNIVIVIVTIIVTTTAIVAITGIVIVVIITVVIAVIIIIIIIVTIVTIVIILAVAVVARCGMRNRIRSISWGTRWIHTARMSTGLNHKRTSLATDEASCVGLETTNMLQQSIRVLQGHSGPVTQNTCGPRPRQV